MAANSENKPKKGFWASLKSFFGLAKIELTQDGVPLTDEQISSIENTEEWEQLHQSLIAKQQEKDEDEKDCGEPQENPEEQEVNNSNNSVDNSAEQNQQNEDMPTTEEIMALIEKQTQPLRTELNEVRAENQRLTQELEAKKAQENQDAEKKKTDRDELLKDQEKIKPFGASSTERKNGLAAPEKIKSENIEIGNVVVYAEAIAELQELPVFDKAIKLASQILPEIKPNKTLPKLNFGK